MKIQDLHQQGWTYKEIGDETGFHPATISERLNADGPPVARAVPDASLVMNACPWPCQSVPWFSSRKPFQTWQRWLPTVTSLAFPARLSDNFAGPVRVVLARPINFQTWKFRFWKYQLWKFALIRSEYGPIRFCRETRTTRAA